jgi:hypothetical protein
LHHEHCNEELDVQERFASKKSKAGKKAALKRWEHKKKRNMRSSCDGYATAMRSDATGQDRTGQDIIPLISPKKPQAKNQKKEEGGNETQFQKFWDQFPRQRRGSKDKALQAYIKAIERDTEQSILAGTLAYAASDEVARGFAKGAQAWLNDDRWTNDYAVVSKGLRQMPNGKRDYMDGLMNAAQNAARATEGMS